MEPTIRPMRISDYHGARTLWETIPGLRLEKADSEEGVARYLARNPDLSFVAEHESEIVGTVLCGEDGRRGYLQHLCVAEKHRNQDLGTKLMAAALDQFSKLLLYEVRIFVLLSNPVGMKYWDSRDWQSRDDIGVFAFQLRK